MTEELMHLRTSHSKLAGFWTSELGGMNEVVHIWEYDNYAHRTKVRKALAEDEKWQNEFIKKAAPMWMDQKNSIMMLLPWSQLITPSQKGIYEMQIFNMNSHAAIWTNRLKAAIELKTSFVEEHKSVLIGAFLTIFGYHNTVVIFWQHQNFDICSIGRLNLLSESNKAIMNAFYHEVGSAYSKGLIPHKVSPLQ
ncbi:protein NipSnap homolog 3B-like [Centruroides sculpturatus]|uniref:protein NipSnap homolog 3B-like n=1 Tax=Centruroides sculpturatus TaxID=218467 RepID=UPI000C6E1A68|nr:protein NipSnap homolog 3B-like [Centruroides sculpturatus]XP_023230947.1 protein NipSnap homolog 3B-like [Centruroides sculpturatus]